jgi:starvation-inducible DNA-binding protein
MALATAEPQKIDKIQTGLQQVVADTYSLLGQTHHCHWNVEGPNFFALHEAFEQQYNDLFQASDEIAERLRALDGYVEGGLQTLAKRAGFKEIATDASANEMVGALLDMHKKAVEDIAETRDHAADAGDKETEDLMIARVQFHEKTIWMLKSYLKG